MQDLGHWTTTLTVPETAYGFIYMITNLVNDRKYIGKKQMVSKRTRPPLKGKKRKRIEFVKPNECDLLFIGPYGEIDYKKKILKMSANVIPGHDGLKIVI